MRLAIGMLIGAAMIAGCASELGMGFHLPQGDPQRGREAFVALHCNECHAVEGIERPANQAAYVVMLGGQTTRVKTYGDLVTSIVNPSHRLPRSIPPERVSVEGESLMSGARLNEVMTVQELIDIVAFLQDEYEFVPPPVRLRSNP